MGAGGADDEGGEGMIENIVAEQSLLGIAMSDVVCAEKLSTLPEDTFSFPVNQVIHKAIKRIVADHKIPDLVTVCNEAPADCPEFTQEVMKCCAGVVGPSMWRQHEQICLDLRKRRLLKAACVGVASKVDDNMIDVDALSADLTKVINDNGNKPQSVSMEDAIVGFIQDLEKTDKVNTGIAGLDSVTGGLKNGTLNIIGARPGVGKTALALTITRYVADRCGPVLFVSLEMSTGEIMTRLFAAEAKLNMQKIVNNTLDADEKFKLLSYTEKVKNLQIRFSMATTPLQIRREAAAMQRDGGLKMIVVDYIQLMRADDSRKSRYEEVSQISRELKLMAMELDVPIVALTQFNRESENGGNHRKPSMSEARDSGSIEQDANTFMVLWAPKEPEDAEKREVWLACQQRGSEMQFLSIDKNRQGPVGMVILEFAKPYMRYMTIWRDKDG